MKKIILFTAVFIICHSCFSQWYRAAGIGDRVVYSIRKIDSYLFSATDSGVYRSSDGINWQMKINGMDPAQLYIRAFYKNGANLYAATWGGLYVSTNYGDNWQFTNYPHPSTPAMSVYAINNIMLASTTAGGLYRSADYGVTWNTVTGNTFWKYTMINGKLFASCLQGVFASLDTGKTWQTTNFTDLPYDLLNVNDTLLVTTYSNSIAKTAAGVISWSYLNALQIDSANGFATKSDTIFVSTGKCVYYFKSKTAPATSLNMSGLNIFPANTLSAIAIFNNLVLVGTEAFSTPNGKGIWYYSLTPLTGISEVNHKDIIEIYPNPSTGMFYMQCLPAGQEGLMTDGNRSLIIDVYNMLGKKISSSMMNDGRSVLNLSQESRGMYFYQITCSGKIIGAGKLLVE